MRGNHIQKLLIELMPPIGDDIDGICTEIFVENPDYTLTLG